MAHSYTIKLPWSQVLDGYSQTIGHLNTFVLPPLGKICSIRLGVGGGEIYKLFCYQFVTYEPLVKTLTKGK